MPNSFFFERQLLEKIKKKKIYFVGNKKLRKKIKNCNFKSKSTNRKITKKKETFFLEKNSKKRKKIFRKAPERHYPIGTFYLAIILLFLRIKLYASNFCGSL